MNITPAPPAALVEALERMGLTALLDGYIARERVGVSFLTVKRVAFKFGYHFAHENGNLYGRLRLIPGPTGPAPRLRLITRNDHAAVFGSRKAM